MARIDMVTVTQNARETRNKKYSSEQITEQLMEACKKIKSRTEIIKQNERISSMEAHNRYVG